MNDFPLLGFPDENYADDILKYRRPIEMKVLYSCHPTPGTVAFVERSGENRECYWVGIYEEGAKMLRHTHRLDCPLHVLAFLHNFVNTHGGNSDHTTIQPPSR